jgi:4-hydroxy-2-oxoheptanedioate aldolase
MFRANMVKARLRAGNPVFGFSLTFAHSAIAELLGLAGSDFVLIDAEHGLGEHRDHLVCLQAISATAAHSIVRLASRDPVEIKRILDIGAEGVMIPGVSSAEEARVFVEACRYPPNGFRGYAAGGIRGSDYGLVTQRYLAEIEPELLLCVMIETAEGVENIAEIAAVDGVDVIQIGANDLSYSIGVPEQLDHPALIDAITRIEAAALAAGKALGGAPSPRSPVPVLIERGYGLITLGRDSGLLANAVRANLNRANDHGREG